LRALPASLGSLFEASAEESDAGVRSVARQFADQLKERWGRELPSLPFDR
jgi:hypothetical protein